MDYLCTCLNSFGLHALRCFLRGEYRIREFLCLGMVPCSVLEFDIQADVALREYYWFTPLLLSVIATRSMRYSSYFTLWRSSEYRRGIRRKGTLNTREWWEYCSIYRGWQPRWSHTRDSCHPSWRAKKTELAGCIFFWSPACEDRGNTPLSRCTLLSLTRLDGHRKCRKDPDRTPLWLLPLCSRSLDGEKMTHCRISHASRSRYSDQYTHYPLWSLDHRFRVMKCWLSQW